MFSVLALTACAIDEGEEDELGDEENLAQTTQAISDVMYTWHSAPFEDGYELDLGSSNDKTCFLVGVKGSLKGAYSYTSSLPYKIASAGVHVVNGRYKVRTKFGYGNGVAAKVGCILHPSGQGPSDVHRVFFGWSQTGYKGSGTEVPKRRYRRCFIDSIWANGHGWTSWPSTPPYNPPGVGIISDGSTWQMAGELVPNSNGDSSGGGGAVCLDVPDGTEQQFSITGSSTGPVTKILSGTSNASCGFHRIEGVFVDEPTPKGLELFFNGSPTWNLRADSSRFVGKANCVTD